MIVRDAHVRMKLLKVDAKITDIRTRFWITRLGRGIRQVISGCSQCKLQRAWPMPPILGPLPEDRLEANGWPFKSAGRDYFAPLLVTVARLQEKRCVALFTCQTTRALYLELAHDLSTDSCNIVVEGQYIDCAVTTEKTLLERTGRRRDLRRSSSPRGSRRSCHVRALIVSLIVHRIRQRVESRSEWCSP